MMVDDDEIFVYLQNIFLKKSGIASKPISAFSGSEALKKIKSISENNVNVLLFLDINMPDMSGWDVLDKINDWSLTEKVYVIIISSSINTEDKQRASTYNNVIYFLEKPVRKEDFMEVKYLKEISGYFS